MAISKEHKRHGYVVRAGKIKWRVGLWIERIRQRAKRHGMECDLKTNDIVIPDLCPLLGIPLFFTDGKQAANTPSIDRIDNSKGYTRDNIQIISWEANRLKSNVTADQARTMKVFWERLEVRMTPTKSKPDSCN